MSEPEAVELPEYLKGLRGRIRPRAVLAKRCWFQVGGEADFLFTPEDVEDLKQFQWQVPLHVPVFILGVGSNLLIRDGGVDGIVLRLGRGFTGIDILHGHKMVVGAAALDTNVALVAREHGIGGLEFLSGIPGTIGGALAMNAGAYGREIKDVLVEAEYVDREGKVHIVTPEALDMKYRHTDVPDDAVFTRAVLQGVPDEVEAIASRMQHISHEREKTQPVHTRTGGSTFKNPAGYKAWQLIDEAGCRGLAIGGAQVSELHCNFLINHGGATAAELETLGEEVRRRVREHSGLMLNWEIMRVGKPKKQEEKA